MCCEHESHVNLCMQAKSLVSFMWPPSSLPLALFPSLPSPLLTCKPMECCEWIFTILYRTLSNGHIYYIYYMRTLLSVTKYSTSQCPVTFGVWVHDLRCETARGMMSCLHYMTPQQCPCGAVVGTSVQATQMSRMILLRHRHTQCCCLG